MTEAVEFFKNTISADLFSLFVGDKIAVGSTRQVYKTTDGYNVLKFETFEKRFQNIVEWETWQIVKDTKYAKWFAPCIDISSCGTILVQRYCRDLMGEELPEELPVFFADIKKENFGIYDGHVKCRDYGNNYLIDRGFNTKKMQKVNW